MLDYKFTKGDDRQPVEETGELEVAGIHVVAKAAGKLVYDHGNKIEVFGTLCRELRDFILQAFDSGQNSPGLFPWERFKPVRYRYVAIGDAATREVSILVMPIGVDTDRLLFEVVNGRWFGALDYRKGVLYDGVNASARPIKNGHKSTILWRGEDYPPGAEDWHEALPAIQKIVNEGRA